MTAVREIFAVDGSTGLDRSTGGLLTGVQENRRTGDFFRQEYRRTFWTRVQENRRTLDKRTKGREDFGQEYRRTFDRSTGGF